MAGALLLGTTTFLPVAPPHASARLAAASAARSPQRLCVAARSPECQGSPVCRRHAARMLVSADEQLAPSVRAADDEFDYVIVGGGTAGCVLANRWPWP